MAKETAPQEATNQNTPPAAPEQAYSLAELMENATTVFGVQPEVISGALYGNPKQEFTVAELKKIIEQFLKKKVK